VSRRTAAAAAAAAAAAGSSSPMSMTNLSPAHRMSLRNSSRLTYFDAAYAVSSFFY